MGKKLNSKKSNEKILNSIISVDKPKSPEAEIYRTLRTNIQFAGIEKEIKTLLVTSTNPSEGKTTTITNLAVVMAQMGNKVLVVDSDLRKPNVHNYLGGDQKKGFTSFLAKIKEVEKSQGQMKIITEDQEANAIDKELMHEYIDGYIHKTEIAGLDSLTSGPVPPNPSEVIGSKAMKTFVKVVSMKYDVILFDTPPVGVVTDATILSALVDGVLFVVSSGGVKIDRVVKAKEQLERANARIIGTVLNKTSGVGSDGYYSYYGD